MGMRTILAAIGGLCLVTTAATGAAGAAGAAAAHGNEYFTITITDHYQSAVVHGAVFTGAGKDVSHGQYEVLHLGGGTLRLTHPDSQLRFALHVNHRTCFAKVVEHGKYSLSNGTGRYAGITGHGTYGGRFKSILKRKKNGKCNMNFEAYGVGVIHARGPATR